MSELQNSSIRLKKYFSILTISTIHKNRSLVLWITAIKVYIFFEPSCSTNPVTDRKQLLIYPETFINKQSAVFYKNFIKRSKISDDKKNTKLMNEIAEKIIKSIDIYFKKL